MSTDLQAQPIGAQVKRGQPLSSFPEPDLGTNQHMSRRTREMTEAGTDALQLGTLPGFQLLGEARTEG